MYVLGQVLYICQSTITSRASAPFGIEPKYLNAADEQPTYDTFNRSEGCARVTKRMYVAYPFFFSVVECAAQIKAELLS